MGTTAELLTTGPGEAMLVGRNGPVRNGLGGGNSVGRNGVGGNGVGRNGVGRIGVGAGLPPPPPPNPLRPGGLIGAAAREMERPTSGESNNGEL
jgi:hypothetical protein